jgi:hypothetical protein
MTDRNPSVTKSARIYIALLACLVSCLGCGSETYERRLAESVAYFQYREKLDLSLELRPWSNLGIEYRPPKGFVELGAPAEGEPDQRQPQFLGKPLPGLITAFKGDVAVDIPGSEIRSMPAWVLLCSNHQLWVEKDTNPQVIPTGYLNNLADELADALKFKRNSAIEPWKFTEERVPRGVAYVPIKNYKYITLDETVNDVSMDVILFQYEVKDIQLAVIAVVPRPVDRRERFFEKMSLGMEQLTMSGEVPRSKQNAKPVGGGGI